MMRFTRLLESGVSGNTVDIHLLGEDNNRYHLELDRMCVAPTVAAMVAQFGKIAPEEASQLINVRGLQTAISDQGLPIILMQLENGSELPLALESMDLGKLIAELQGLSERLPSGRSRH